MTTWDIYCNNAPNFVSFRQACHDPVTQAWYNRYSSTQPMEEPDEGTICRFQTNYARSPFQICSLA